MARVKMESIIDYLDSDMKKALKRAIDEVAPKNDVDASTLFRAFLREVDRCCNTWETVPDQYVQKN